MAQARNGNTVKVHYTGKLADGTIFDSSNGGDPLELALGAGQVIAGFEEAIVGMNTGESKTIEISADQAYGPRNEDLVMEVGRNEVPEELNAQVGQQLQVRQDNGKSFLVTVTDVSESSLTLDANHPLAGKDLTFDIELVEVA